MLNLAAAQFVWNPIAGPLLDRFTEIGVPSDVVNMICFGVNPATKMAAKAFMKGQHVLMTKGAKCVLLPPNASLKAALYHMEEKL